MNTMPRASVLVENHSTVLGYWSAMQIQQAVVVHVDAHLDLGWTAESALPTLRAKPGFALLDEERDGITYTQPGVFDLGSYLSTALELGIVRHIYCVIPDHMWFEDAAAVRAHLIEQTQGIAVEVLQNLAEYDGRYEIRLARGQLTLCTLRTLPPIAEPVLLDIDVDFLLLSDPAGSTKAWITPNALANVLTARLRHIDLITVAISEHGGYTPPPWRQLAHPIMRAFDACIVDGHHVAERYPPLSLRGTRVYEQYTQGLTLLLQHKPASALPLLADVANCHHAVAGYHYAYALALHRCGNIAEAIAAYEQACACGEPFAHMLNNLAGLFMEQGKMERAQHALEQAVALEPASATFAANLGHLFVLQEQHRSAEAWLRSALSLQPAHLEASYLLATLLLQRGAGDEGLPLLAQCQELAKGLPMERIVSVSYQRWQRDYHL